MITTNLKILRTNNTDVASIEEADKIVKMLEIDLSMSKIKGAGLAAPQISINKRVCIIRIKEFDEIINLANPIIIDKRGPCISKEGCLSLPGIYVEVYRYKELFVKDLYHPNGVVLADLAAIVAEHEIDHLNGILIIDKDIKNVKRNDECPCGLRINNKAIKFKHCHGREL